MASKSRTDWDPLAAIAAITALVMMGVYIGLIRQQGDQVVVWFVAGLAAGAVLAVYGVARAAPWRGMALVVAGVVLAVLGFLSLASIGFPILVAGVLTLIAAARSRSAG